jgi:hypothetical protein
LTDVDIAVGFTPWLVTTGVAPYPTGDEDSGVSWETAVPGIVAITEVVGWTAGVGLPYPEGLFP